ncbi:CYFA0S01e20010g1_1 [Cyberlindnera fabianii]|uniref:CYFA0S01e20010g1_1 n=1 Tax=Cyberlindnera fabianii TaxID=36022 RepID=A0A061ALK3_CYBFA|nr:CYFA0S01e20010g1_1 [Cyberlindnera fabianii]
MQPLVSAGNAWCCTVLSAFGTIILAFIGYLFSSNHESMMGSINDPEDGKAVAHTIYLSALVYLVFFGFCGSQILVHKRVARSRIQL